MICFITQIDEDHHLKQLNSGLPKKKGCCKVLKLENHSFQRVSGLIISFTSKKIDLSKKKKGKSNIINDNCLNSVAVYPRSLRA